MTFQESNPQDSPRVLDDQDRWHFRFLELAFLMSTWSRDPSTKCGAVLVRPDKTVASLGFNGFPQGMNDDPTLYSDRPVKYDRVVHAEMNALLFCRDVLPLSSHILYTTAPCCSRCLVHMIQAGIRTFVWPTETPEQRIRWNTDATRRYLEEVGATLWEVPLRERNSS